MTSKSAALEILECHAELRQQLGANLLAAAGRAEPGVHPERLLMLQADDLVITLVDLGAEVLGMTEVEVGNSSMTVMLTRLSEAIPADARGRLLELSCIIHTVHLARFYQGELKKAHEGKTWLNPAIYAPRGVQA